MTALLKIIKVRRIQLSLTIYKCLTNYLTYGGLLPNSAFTVSTFLYRDDSWVMPSRYRQTMVPANNKPTDTMADPALWNNTWRSWQDPPEVGSRLLLQLLTVTIILVSLVCLVTTVFRHSSPFTLLPTSSAPTTRLDVPHLEPEKTVLNIDSHNYWWPYSLVDLPKSDLV